MGNYPVFAASQEQEPPLRVILCKVDGVNKDASVLDSQARSWSACEGKTAWLSDLHFSERLMFAESL